MSPVLTPSDHKSRITDRYSLLHSIDGVAMLNVPQFARCEVFTAVKICVVVLWIVIRCSVAAGYQRLRGPC